MEVEAYVAARHAALVRVAVLLGRPRDRAAALVSGVLTRRARAIRRADDPDALVLAALHGEVLADRLAHPAEVVPRPRPDRPAGADDEGLEVRRTLGDLPVDLRDPAVLAFGVALEPHDLADVLGVRPRDLRALVARARTGLGATDETDARRKLSLAGDTVAVDPPAPGPSAVPSRALPLAAAATAVLLAAGGAAWLSWPGASSPRGPDVPDSPRPSSGLPRTLRGDQVPSFFSYRVPEALARLRGNALATSVERLDVCEPPGVVLGTSPSTGAAFRSGDTVTVTAARRHTHPCRGYDDRVAAWAFLAFAAGRGPAPASAPRVRVVLDDDPPVTLAAPRSGASAAWRSYLAPVARAAAQVGVDTMTYRTPVLTTQRRVPPASACGLARPADVGSRTALELTVAAPTGTGGCPLTVDLYRTPTGRLDAVVVRRPRAAGQ